MQLIRNLFFPVGLALWLGLGFLLCGLSALAQQTKPDPQEAVFGNCDNIDPQFPGGTKGLLVYLEKEVNYPDSAARANITGKVFISFVIDAKGQISRPQILRALGYGCDAEAIRVVNAMPSWRPATRCSGEPIAVSYNMPILFGPK